MNSPHDSPKKAAIRVATVCSEYVSDDASVVLAAVLRVLIPPGKVTDAALCEAVILGDQIAHDLRKEEATTQQPISTAIDAAIVRAALMDRPSTPADERPASGPNRQSCCGAEKPCHMASCFTLNPGDCS